MSIFNEFPYTNFHDLNLDWIISKVRELDESWQTVSNEWSDFREYVNNYLANLDIDAGLREIINEMISTGEFMDLVRTADAETINAWLAANITNPSNPPLDRTFLLSGAAANSQQVGFITKPNQNLVNIGDMTTTDVNVSVVESSLAGTAEITGAATTGHTFNIHDVNGDHFSFIAQAGVTYTLSGCPQGGGLNTFDLDLRTTPGGAINYYDSGDGVTFTPVTDQRLYLHIRLSQGNGNGLVFKPQIERRSFKTAFVPYAHKSAKDTGADAFIDNISNLVDTEFTQGYTVNKMLSVAKTYIEHNSDLVYGQQTAVHWYENGVDVTKERIYTEGRTPTEIDCSAFTTLVVQGIPYEMSRYATDKNHIGYAGYGFDIYRGDETARENSAKLTLASWMAEWAVDNGYGENVEAAARAESLRGVLKPGDVLFFSVNNPEAGVWEGIDHCEIFLGFQYNWNENYKALITMNVQDNRDETCQISIRNKDFYNGTNAAGRVLSYIARFPQPLARNKNLVIYQNPQRNIMYRAKLEVPANEVYHIVFDGKINVANGNFVIYLDEQPRGVTPQIKAGEVGQLLRYDILMPTRWGNAETVSIRCNNDTSAIIEDCFISRGVNY